MVRTNKDELVEIAVAGEIVSPRLTTPPYRPDKNGRATVMIGMAGIAYNVRVGDPAFGWAADHLEPGVSVRNACPERNYAMHYLTCIGNRAVVASGEARGARGRVSGEHSGLLIDFETDDLVGMCIGDRVVVRAFGAGLELLDYPHISIRNCSPELIESMGLEPTGEGMLRIPVTHEIPSRLMGSGMELLPEYVDQDMMTQDSELIEELGLANLRLGDLVAVTDMDYSHGRGYHEGATVIGVIIHGDSFISGHGPGVLGLLSCQTPHIVPVIDDGANIGKLLRLGRWAEGRT